MEHDEMVRTIPLLSALALLCTAAAASAQSAPPDSTRSAADGAYTTTQAAAGEELFGQICGNCHSPSQFHGSAFLKYWSGRPVYELFDQLRVTMPLDNPGGLSSDQYASVIAYILKLNDYPAGEEALPSGEALKRIRF